MELENSQEFVGEPDGYERLWTPYRMVYIDSARERGNNSQELDGSTCPFCVAPTKDDATSLIVHRGLHCFVVMNLFPYNGGHLLVCPYRHVADFTELTEQERIELGNLTSDAMRISRKVLSPSGFNLGMNQGSVAGAGIAEHLHQHIVPRWPNDSNFFPIIAKSKAIPVLLEETRERLAAEWKALAAEQEEGDLGTR